MRRKNIIMPSMYHQAGCSVFSFSIEVQSLDFSYLLRLLLRGEWGKSWEIFELRKEIYHQMVVLGLKEQSRPSVIKVTLD